MKGLPKSIYITTMWNISRIDILWFWHFGVVMSVLEYWISILLNKIRMVLSQHFQLQWK